MGAVKRDRRLPLLLPEFCRLLGCYTALVGYAPTFPDYVSVPHLRVNITFSLLNMGPIRSPETSVQNRSTLRNIPEDDRILCGTYICLCALQASECECGRKGREVVQRQPCCDAEQEMICCSD